MKKYFTLLLVLSLLWMPWMPNAYAAADIPASQGLITDDAGMLSGDQIAALEALAAGTSYTVHILTVSSLNGTASADFATAVYDAWSLRAQDVLLLISEGDSTVELNFDNPGLQSAIDAWAQGRGGSSGSAAITQLLDYDFIPYAQDGDFAGGIRSVTEHLQSLGNGTATGGTGGNTATEGSSSQGTPGTATTGTSANSRSASSFLTGIAIVITILLLAALLLALFTGLRRRKQFGARQEELAELLVRANRALESLQPFQGIVQGRTGEMVEGISKRLSAQLVDISTLQGASPALPIYRLKALKEAIAKLEQNIATWRGRIEDEERLVAEISDADRNVRQQINELKQDAPALDGQLQETVSETGYALQEIAEELRELAEETAKADQLELFDPIAAQEIAEDAQERQERIEQDLRDVDIYSDKLSAFAGELAAHRSRIADIIEQNSLHNMKVKPYDLLKEAEGFATALQTPLQQGDMDEVRSLAAKLDTALAEAVALTERQAQIRQSNQRDLETVRGTWSGLYARLSGLHSQTAAARGRFAEAHVAPLQAALETAAAALKQGEAEVPQIAAWTDDARGEYDKARDSLDRLLTLQEDVSRRLAEISGSLDELEARFTAARRLFEEGQQRADSAQRLLHSRGLAGMVRFELHLLPEYDRLAQQLSSPPYNLDELENTARSYSAQIAAFADEAARLVRRKEEEERQAQLARMREQQRREAARRRMSSGPPFSGGPGGRPGGGRSSGGSSWGGGGRSSGGSSWGGGGKSGRNSSGGSKW